MQFKIVSFWINIRITSAHLKSQKRRQSSTQTFFRTLMYLFVFKHTEQPGLYGTVTWMLSFTAISCSSERSSQQDLCMKILLHHLYQDPSGPLYQNRISALVRNLFVNFQGTTCARLLLQELCVNVLLTILWWFYFWEISAAGPVGPLYQAPIGALARNPRHLLHDLCLIPFGPPVLGSRISTCAKSLHIFCIRIFWTTCIKLPQDNLHKVSHQDAFRPRVSRYSGTTCARSRYQDHLSQKWIFTNHLTIANSNQIIYIDTFKSAF